MAPMNRLKNKVPKSTITLIFPKKNMILATMSSVASEEQFLKVSMSKKKGRFRPNMIIKASTPQRMEKAHLNSSPFFQKSKETARTPTAKGISPSI